MGCFRKSTHGNNYYKLSGKDKYKNRHDLYPSKISKETTLYESPNEHKHFIP